MKIIVPMAGIGKRMRPHTLTIPKPLLPIAGKPIVQRLVEDIAAIANEPIDEIAFIIGDFGQEVETNLVAIAKDLGAKGSIYHQEEALGTAHAILCAQESLNGPVIVAFADTLFKADFKLDETSDGIVWVEKVADPSAFGVVQLNEEGNIAAFIEKPETFVSDLAIIGIYFFRDGDNLKKELQYLIDNDLRDRGEYQLTDALKHMNDKGLIFSPGKVEEWLDCGNKDATVYTNQRILEFKKSESMVSSTAIMENAQIIPPCYIGEHVILRNSTVGPHASIGDNTEVNGSTISNSIVQKNSKIESCVIRNSMVGNFVDIKNANAELSIGDFSTYYGS